MSDAYKTHLASQAWAEKREAVRKRARGQCERCQKAKMQAVHHLTYERVGAERLTDLQAICYPCRQFLSAETDVDPTTEGMRVYLAGPITGTSWRDDLLASDRCFFESETKWGADKNGLSEATAWPAVSRGLKGGFDFTGPWFEDTTGGHGRVDFDGPHAHGWELCFRDHNCPGTRAYVAAACRAAIECSHIVFCWIPPDCAPYGTVWELGYATAYEKIIIVAQHPMNADFWWLAAQTADSRLFAETASAAWDAFLKEWQRSEMLRRQVRSKINSTAPFRCTAH